MLVKLRYVKKLKGIWKGEGLRVKEENADGDDTMEGDNDNVDDSMLEIFFG